jgi:hypothetical protein
VRIVGRRSDGGGASSSVHTLPRFDVVGSIVEHVSASGSDGVVVLTVERPPAKCAGYRTAARRCRDRGAGGRRFFSAVADLKAVPSCGQAASGSGPGIRLMSETASSPPNPSSTTSSSSSRRMAGAPRGAPASLNSRTRREGRNGSSNGSPAAICAGGRRFCGGRRRRAGFTFRRGRPSERWHAHARRL